VVKLNKELKMKSIYSIAAVLVLSSIDAVATQFSFSYTFNSDWFGAQPYTPGSKLTGQFEGTIDPDDPNRVIISAFGQVSLHRTGYERFDYEGIDVTEFNSWPSGELPFATFDGVEINFRSCPGGFTMPELAPDDCPFSGAPGGGFVVASEAAFNPAVGYVTAADGTGDAGSCYSVTGIPGCRVTGFYDSTQWLMEALPDGINPNAVIDPSVDIGDDTNINSGVVIEANVELGDQVDVNHGTTIGADTEVNDNVVLNRNSDIGSNIFIGNDVTIGQGVVIKDNVTIEDGVTIGKGSYVCPGITIGNSAEIGKNNLIVDNVNAGDILFGLKLLPGDGC